MRAIHPKRPVRAAVIAFVALSAVISVGLVFDERGLNEWPWAFGYCALLAVVVVGLVRNGPRALLLLKGATVAALVPGFIGFALMRSATEFETGSHWKWLRISLYLLYALCLPTLWLVIRGWLLYRKDSIGTGSTRPSNGTGLEKKFH